MENRFIHQERAAAVSGFQQHVSQLAEYLHTRVVTNNLTVNALIGLHKRLYPPDFKIVTRNGQGNLAAIEPGGWRQKELFPEYGWYTSCSPTNSIEADLYDLLLAFAGIGAPCREDIFRFYFLFLKVHPFADSNGTLAALLADTLAYKYGLLPFFMLHLRFKDKVVLHSFFERFEEDTKSNALIAALLQELDSFHKENPMPSFAEITAW